MTNPFDDLESEEPDADAETEPPSSDSSEPSTAPPASQPTPDPAESAVSESGPAFEYSDVRQKPLYARDETWTAFEKKLRTSIAPTLANADVVDEETREIHDAVLRLANQEPDRVAELVLDARRNAE